MRSRAHRLVMRSPRLAVPESVSSIEKEGISDLSSLDVSVVSSTSFLSMVDAHLAVEGVAAVLSSRPGVCIIVCEGRGATILPALGFGTKESVLWRTAPSNSKVLVDCFILSFNLLCLDSEKNF